MRERGRHSNRSRTKPPVRPALLLALAGVAVLAGLRCTLDGDDALLLVEDRRLPRSEYLVRQLATGETPVRRARAALAMGRIQSDEYLPALVAAARGEDGAPRRAALFALGQMGLALGARPDAGAVAACREALAAEDAATVAAALEALGKQAPDGLAVDLARWLDHPQPQAREAAVHALFRTRFVPVWRRQVAEPPRWPDEAVAALAAALDDSESAVRRAAAHALSRWGEPRAGASLRSALGDEDVWVRMFAARALGRSGDDGAIGALVVLADDESLHVRTEAVTAIGALGGGAGLPETLDTDASFAVRAALAAALGQAGGDGAVRGRLGRLLADPSPAVVAAALEAVSKVDGTRFAPRLAHWLEDERWPVRAAAARAAAALGGAGEGVMSQALADPDLRVRVAALEVAPAGPPTDTTVREALRQPDLALRGTAVARLARSPSGDNAALLREAYAASRGPDWIEVRETVVDALARDAGSADLLRRAARDDPAGSVRARARLALAALGHGSPEVQGREPAPSPFLGVTYEQDPVVELETDKGVLRIRCLAAEAPVHTAMFVSLVRQGFYDGGTWHRVVPNFVVQGGDPRGDGWGGSRWLVRDEIAPVPFDRGTVGMPKAGKDTGSGQLFITHVPTPHLEGNYTAFGRVVEGLDVVDRLEVGDGIRRGRVVVP